MQCSVTLLKALDAVRSSISIRSSAILGVSAMELEICAEIISFDWGWSSDVSLRDLKYSNVGTLVLVVLNSCFEDIEIAEGRMVVPMRPMIDSSMFGASFSVASREWNIEILPFSPVAIVAKDSG